MKSLLIACTTILLCALAAIGASPSFEQAVPGRALVFPRDHGKHPSFQTEWWYFTGNLNSGDRSWGFQLTFFRRSLSSEPAREQSRWAARDVYPAHFALTDVKNGEFFHAELISREGPGLAAAAEDDLGVHVRDWSAERVGERIHVKARDRGYALQLVLEPLRPVVLHGRNGYSRKGAADTQASYYYSFTRLRAAGSLTFKGISHEVSGYAWMDHEFGSSILTPEQVGWDWFSLQLDDESDLMLFHLRQKDGSAEPTFGTLVRPDGHVVDLAGRSIVISTTETWTSPRSPAKYPSAWNVEIPSEGISLIVAASVADQELVTGGSTAITYWEGAVHIKGTRNGRTVRGRGYVELTGYAHSLKGRL